MQEKETWSEKNKRISQLPEMQRQRYRAKITIIVTIVAYALIMPIEHYVRKTFGTDAGFGGMLVAVSSLFIGFVTGEHKAIKKYGR